MRNHKTIARLLASATAIAALFAIQATAASATVYTLVSPGTTHTTVASSNLTFSAMAGHSAHSHIACTISGGQYTTLTTGIDAPAWWDGISSPGVSCPAGSGAAWTTAGWQLGVQGSPFGSHTGIVKIPAYGLRVSVGNGCGTLEVRQAVTLNGQWVDGAGSIDAKIRFNQDTNVPVYYAGNCAGLGATGPQNLVIDAGSELKVRNVSPFGAFSVVVYVA